MLLTQIVPPDKGTAVENDSGTIRYHKVDLASCSIGGVMRVRSGLIQGVVVATILCLTAYGCTPLRQSVTPQVATVAQARSVIFDAAATSRFLWTLDRCSEFPIDSIAGTWTATVADTRLLDSILPGALHASLDSRIPLRAEDYFFQYFGVLRHGRRIVLINGFHDAVRRAGLNQPANWTQVPVVVCDAGFGAFQATYELNNGRLSELRFFSSLNGAP